MAGWLEGWRHGGGKVLAVCAAIACIASLSACGTTSGHMSSASGGDTVTTPSDETEIRRRARIRLELAANYFQMGQTTVALDEVKQSLATDPSYADAHHLHGLIFMRLGDLSQAEESLKRAQGLRPSDPDIMHNYGWLQCQRQRYAEANQLFDRALTVPTYMARSKTLMSQGLCYERAGRVAEAEQTLLKSYELDAGNPVVGYNLASLMLRKGDSKRAQFYIRRLNNGEFSNAESLWLGIKVERALGEPVAMRQLGDQLRKRFPDSKELLAFERGAFNE